MQRRTAAIGAGVVLVLIVGCMGATALANGAATATDPNTWTAMNAIVNAASLIGGVLASVVAWVVRSINMRLKRMNELLEAWGDWQREHYEATRANVTLLATKQNGHEVACVGEHGPMAGRPSVPEVPMFDWPAPPRRRSNDQTF